MQTITTKYIGPARSHGPRIKATSASGQTTTVPYDYALNEVSAHRVAVKALCKKLGWDANKLYPGSLKDGFVWVFMPNNCRFKL